MNCKIFIKYFFTIILFIIISGCSKQINFPKIEEGIFSDREIKTYRSKKIRITTGDTLISISKKYKVSIQEIIKFNSLKPPYVLKPGKTLSLPKAIKYKIKKGDSLFKIARCAKVSTEDIKQRNKNLQVRKLIIGKIIKLPYFANADNCKKVLQKFNKKNKSDKNDKKYKRIFKWPVSGKVIATFGLKNSGRRNDGINIKAPYGSPIRSAKSGKVIYRGNELPAWGNLILVKHNNGWTTAYAHLDKFYVQIGDKLKSGDILGSIGKTGNVDDYQLHFQIRKNSRPVDPLKYLFK